MPTDDDHDDGDWADVALTALLADEPMPHDPMVTIWPWADAPQHLRDISTNGGDEDYLTLIPAKYVKDFIEPHADSPWMGESAEVVLVDGQSTLHMAIERLGVCGTDYCRLGNGDVVAISYHA